MTAPTKALKIIDFKTVSPLFEMERDGIRPFTERLIDPKDRRFKALNQWNSRRNWAIRITNPQTGEQFTRKLEAVSYIIWFDDKQLFKHSYLYTWRFLKLGERIPQPQEAQR